MLLRVVAEEDRGTLFPDERLRDGALVVADRVPCRAADVLAGELGHRRRDRGERSRERIGPRRDARGDRHEEIVVGDVHR